MPITSRPRALLTIGGGTDTIRRAIDREGGALIAEGDAAYVEGDVPLDARNRIGIRPGGKGAG